MYELQHMRILCLEFSNSASLYKNVFRKRGRAFTVKPALVATSIEQATCIKQASVQFPKRANTLK